MRARIALSLALYACADSAEPLILPRASVYTVVDPVAWDYDSLRLAVKPFGPNGWSDYMRLSTGRQEWPEVNGGSRYVFELVWNHPHGVDECKTRAILVRREAVVHVHEPGGMHVEVDGARPRSFHCTFHRDVGTD